MKVRADYHLDGKLRPVPLKRMQTHAFHITDLNPTREEKEAEHSLLFLFDLCTLVCRAVREYL